MGIKNILTNLSHVKYINRWIVFITDVIFSTIATGIAFAFTSYIIELGFSRFTLLLIFLLSVLSSSISFFGLQIYKNVIRHSTFVETGRIAMAAFLKVAILFLLMYVIIPQWTTKGLVSECITDFCATFFILTTVRVIMIHGYNFIKDKAFDGSENLLICGPGWDLRYL